MFVKTNLLILAAKPRLARFNHFAKTELYPPMPTDIPQIISGFGKLISGARQGNWKRVSVKEATINACITIEVLCWFFVGEVIGKRHVRGYDV